MTSCLLTLSPSLIVELAKSRKMSYQRKFQEDMQRATGRFQDLVQENKVIITLNFGFLLFLKDM